MSTPGRSPGGFRGYTTEQKTLRAKLDLIIKWGRDLKSSMMKQSCKVLQTTNTNPRETIDQIHDDLDDYKRKLDRELGLIHDICDALIVNNQGLNGDEENLNNEILEALRRSPTYSSLEQHMLDDTRTRIRGSSMRFASQQRANDTDGDSQVIDDSGDEIIELSDEDTPSKPSRSSRQSMWTTSEIQISRDSSQSQSMHNPYRIGIADPSIRSVFLPPPSSQSSSQSTTASNRRAPAKRAAGIR